ncbi:MAG: peptidoglycan DD-metalloendopeptidase family protein [Anaerolineae bacterium]
MLIKLTAKRRVEVDGQQYLRLLRWHGEMARNLRTVGMGGGALARRYGLHLSIACAALLAVLLPSLSSTAFDFSLSPSAQSAAETRPYAGDVVSFRGASNVPVIADTGLLERQALVRTVGAYYPEVMVTRYQVQGGDTLYTIADRFGLSVLTVYWANQSLVKEPDALGLGQDLAILPTDGAYHTVADGETIEGIATAYRVMPEIILGYSGNKVPDPQHLAVGTQLVIPGAELPELPAKVVPTSAPADSNTGQTYTAAPSDTAPGTGQIVWPVSGMISQRAHSGHMAIDIAGSTGTAVVAADSGTVTLVSWMTTSYGYHIIIDHGNGLETLYAHLSEIDVEVGQVVNQGDVIGKRGNTGRSTGPHLHFEVRENGVKRDPMDYLP